MSPDASRTAVLLMAHGTPDSLDELPEYLTRVRGGRPPSPQLLEEIRRSYAAIGGRSPLTAITLAQGAALQGLLGDGILVAVGMRNWTPYIADAVAAIARPGIDLIVGIPLAPQFSTLSVKKYIEAACEAAPPGIAVECIASFHDHPMLLQAFAERIRAAEPSAGEEVVFTAHSLPLRVLEAGDPYAEQVAATSAGVASMAGVQQYREAFQSAGRTPEPWAGPDISELIRARTAAGVRRFLVVPVGFVCDHTEILFDIDVRAAGVARECGASLRRTESLNTSPTFIRLLAALARDAIDKRVDGRRQTVDSLPHER